MTSNETRGILKGIGIGMILCSAIFYMMVLDLRVSYDNAVNDNDRIIEEAEELGMQFPVDGVSSEGMTEEEIIEAAKELGMVFHNDNN